MVRLPPAPGVAKLTFFQECAGRTFGDSIFIWHTDSSPWTILELGALSGKGVVAYTAPAGLLPLQQPQMTFVGAKALDLSDYAGREVITPSGLPGTSVGTEPLPLNAVAHISGQIGRRYRGARPGYNVSCLDRAQMSDDRLFDTGSAQTILDAFTNTVANVLGGSYGSPVENVGVSYFLENVLRVSPDVSNILGWAIQLRLSTLRRRLGKGVRNI